MYSINDNLESMYFISLNSKRSTLNFCLKIVSSTLHMLQPMEPFFYCNNGVGIRKITKSVSLCFSEDLDEAIINELQNPVTFVTSLVDLISPIGQVMSKVSNTFNNSFPLDCQKASVPIQIQLLCSVLIDECNLQIKCLGQLTKTIAQLVIYQYRKMTAHSSLVT